MTSPTADQITFWDALATALESGQPLPAALERGRVAVAGSSLEPAVAQVQKSVAEGKPLSGALEAASAGGAFGVGVRGLIRTGETVGRVPAYSRMVVEGLRDQTLCPPGPVDGPMAGVWFWLAMHRFLSAGLPVLRTMEIMADETVGGRWAEAAASIRRAVLQGKRLADGLRELPDLFPPETVAAIEGGESSGRVLEEIQRVARAMQAGGVAPTPGGAGAGASGGATAGTTDAVEDIIRFMNQMFVRAVEARATDLHIEPIEGGGLVRFRIDGTLVQIETVQEERLAQLVSRIKLMASMDAGEKQRPQDGRIQLRIRNEPIDLRVSVVPVVQGERVVLRLLRREALTFKLADMHFAARELEQVRALCRQRSGIILVTGPTGSGKTTLLYSMLGEIASPGRNVMSIEDPVEYILPGVSQVQVSPRVGQTFAAAARTCFRQDPDVLMIGELLDTDTVMFAIHAALTGHLVLSSLHTNNAAAAWRRLVDLDVKPFLLTCVAGVIAQRLVRVLCTKCRRPVEPDPLSLPPIASGVLAQIPSPTFFEPVGCDECMGTGYRGRRAIHEVLLPTPEVRKAAIMRDTDVASIHHAAVASGMRSMWADGLACAAAGVTTLAELYTVLPPEPEAAVVVQPVSRV
ncbi:MAG: Flp pilus assembly complex ATPase component TadA [Planctomycetes bacterium]|nr:Flp pilus assembly complex ATPase component TadA [Planctomycetota bacterium]